MISQRDIPEDQIPFNADEPIEDVWDGRIDAPPPDDLAEPGFQSPPRNDLERVRLHCKPFLDIVTKRKELR